MKKLLAIGLLSVCSAGGSQISDLLSLLPHPLTPLDYYTLGVYVGNTCAAAEAETPRECTLRYTKYLLNLVVSEPEPKDIALSQYLKVDGGSTIHDTIIGNRDLPCRTDPGSNRMC